MAKDVVSAPDYLRLMQFAATAEVEAKGVSVRSEEERVAAVAKLTEIRKAKKDLERLKEASLAFPKLYARVARDMFAQVDDPLGRADAMVSRVVLAWMRAQEEELEKAAEAAKARREAGVTQAAVQESVDPLTGEVVELAGGQGMVEQPVKPETIKVEGGSAGLVKGAVRIRVDDPIAVLKAIASTSKRLTHCTMGLVRLDHAAIHRLVVVEGKKVPGVSTYQEESTLRVTTKN